MKSLQNQRRRLIQAVTVALFAFVFLTGPVDGQPPFPPDPHLEYYSFNDTNWLSFSGDAPIFATNLVSIPEWRGNGLLLDATNSQPAYLAYSVVETNGHTNIAFSAGVVTCVFVCDWATADTNQNGTGPGDIAWLLAAGDFSTGSPNGLWGIYIDAGGSNIYFGGVSNSTSTVFVSAPISWASNSIHLISLSYYTNTSLYLDGQLAATGDPVSIVPATNVWSNGFNVGSDSLGYEQARGIFKYLELDDSNWFSMNNIDNFYFTNWWPNISNAYAVWQGGGAGPDSQGTLHSDGGSTNCVTGTNVYLTNMSYGVFSGSGNTFTFTIAGGQPGPVYDVFETTNLTQPLANAVWAWLGSGTNCGIYTATNQPSVQSFYLLGTPQDSDGDGLTDAYELLVSHTNPYNADTSGDGMLDGWKVLWGLNPSINNSAQSSERANYAYDGVGRLEESTSGSWTEIFSFDAEGNIGSDQP
jgi:hypothetical protein